MQSESSNRLNVYLKEAVNYCRQNLMSLIISAALILALPFVSSASWLNGTADSTGNVGSYASMAIDSSDNMHVSYYDSLPNNDLKYAVCPSVSDCTISANWSKVIVDNGGDAGMYTSISADSSGNVHISYYDNANGDLKYATNSGVEIGSGNCTNADWDCETVDSTGDVGKYSSIAIDSSGYIHISYYDVTNAVLKLVTNASGSWMDEVVDITENTGTYSSAVIDSSDNLHISYYKSFPDYDLMYATNASGLWVIQTVDDEGSAGTYNSIALDSLNNVHISYHYFEGRDLKYATNRNVSSGSGTCSSASWDCETVDNAWRTGLHTSIAMDSADNVHITYLDFGSIILRYATDATDSWVTSTLDSAGSTGSYSSIALDSLDNVHISYFNETYYDLKYATNIMKTLSVARAGTGQGAVTSTPSGINCGSECSVDYISNTTVTLTALPDAGSSFSGWSGDVDCSDGIITMNADRNCIATFELLHTLAVTVTGSGIVSSSPAGIDCGSDCSEDFENGTVVTLTAIPDAGSSFAGWSGAGCSGTGTCQVTMSGTGSVTADFDIDYYALDITKTGTGTGVVTSLPVGIDCGEDCTEDFVYNTSVDLTAAADAGSVFAGWIGDADCLDGSVSMNSIKSCNAIFNSRYVLTTSAAPSGNGSVTPDCSGGCTHDDGTIIVLTAHEDSGYPLNSWTGCDSPLESICTMTMDADKSVTAVFDSCMYPVKLDGASIVYLDYIQDAYDNAAEGDTIEIQDFTFVENVLFDNSISVIFNPGYDCNYSGNTEITTVIGDLTISYGSITIESGTLELR